MKKFIIKSLLFLSPIILLQIFLSLFYSKDKGDLLRIGYIMNSDINYRAIFEKEYKEKEVYDRISEIDLCKRHHYSVLTIGDSFSEQGGVGYQNHLAKNSNISILHYDRFLHDNPLQTLNDILNGDLLDHIKVDYIILQSVERLIVERGVRVNNGKVILKDSLREIIESHENVDKSIKPIKHAQKFFSRAILSFPLMNLKFLLDDNAYNSRTYRVRTKERLFSTDKNEILFLGQSLEKVEVNNNFCAVLKLNDVLNSLSNRVKEKGLKLIVLPSPDKYDFYYNQIVDKSRYQPPLFFEHMKRMKKEYIFFDSKELLLQEKKMKNIYYFDDSHWSPIAAKVIAGKLGDILSK